MLESSAGTGTAGFEYSAGTGSEEAGGGESSTDCESFSVLEVEGPEGHSSSQQVAFRQVDPVELESLLETETRIHIERPPVPGIEDDLNGTVGLLCRSHFHPVDEMELANETLGFVHEKRIEAFADFKKEFAPQKPFIRVGVNAVREIVEPRECATLRGGVRVENGMYVDDDGRHFPLGARLPGEWGGRTGECRGRRRTEKG